MAVVRITQIDGNLPNLALMRLAAWHRAKGDNVIVTRRIRPYAYEPRYDIVYGSAIFDFSSAEIEQFLDAWPNAILGGTGTASSLTVDDIIGDSWKSVDYAGFTAIDRRRECVKPDYSMGFTQRGCRLACKFCLVPRKEGRARSENSIYDIWRGDPHPRRLHLLDNDFFGNPEWRARVAEIRDGGFRVCLSQGINLRLIDDEQAEALASVQYRDTTFKRRVLYTAWDNLRDERRFFDGVARLEKHGIPPTHLRTFMLVGYDKAETWERIWYRFNRMVAIGIEPFVMVFDRSREDLKCFARWANNGMYRMAQCSWPKYKRATKSPESLAAYFAAKESDRRGEIRTEVEFEAAYTEAKTLVRLRLGNNPAAKISIFQSLDSISDAALLTRTVRQLEQDRVIKPSADSGRSGNQEYELCEAVHG